MVLIRAARVEDTPKLGRIERSAASLFRGAGLAWVAEAETMPQALLEGFRQDGTLWVAVTEANEPVGFLAGQQLDGAFHIPELSVTAAHQRRGIGGRLIRSVLDHARLIGFGSVTLTTYRDLPWNAPFYAKLGFTEDTAARFGCGHVCKIRDEADAGHDPSRRCVMVKWV